MLVAMKSHQLLNTGVDPSGESGNKRVKKKGKVAEGTGYYCFNG
jgi:hypothetical protein